MDEFQKTEARNYLIAGGLLLAGILCLVSVLSGDKFFNATAISMPCAIGGVILIIIGIVLLALQKRDLAGVSFIIMGAAHFLTMFNAPDSYMVLSLARAAALVWGIVLLFSKDKQKWVFAPLSILLGLFFIIRPYSADISAMGTLLYVVFIASAVIAIYFALAAGFERIRLPGRNLLTSDETTDFKKAGSSIGYALFGTAVLCYGLLYCSIPGYSVSGEAIQGLSIGLGLLLILFGILLFAIGKMRFTPVMFILMGSAEMIASFSTGPMMYAMGALVIVTGLFAILRKESRILPGLMLIFYGVTYFFSAIVGGVVGTPIDSAVLNFIPAAIALYLAIATLSQRKMPLF